MSIALQPFHLLIIALAGSINRDQQAVIDYLIEENRVLRDQLEGRRLRFTDEKRNGFLLDSEFLIMDRDTKYTKAFRANLKREDIEPVRCPVPAPKCNAFAERFVRSIKEECLERMLLFGEASPFAEYSENAFHIIMPNEISRE